MKILHIIPSYVPGHFASGPIKPTHYLNRELARMGVDVSVYTTDLDARERLNVALGKEVNVDGVRVTYFKVGAPLSWFYSSGMCRALLRNTEKFDLIHITSVFLSASSIGAHYAKKFNKPYIISPHGSFMANPMARHRFKKSLYLKFLEKKNLEGAAAMHFVAETEKRDYLKTGLPLKRALVIPNGLDAKEFDVAGIGRDEFRQKLKVPAGNKIILFLARLHPIKGLDTLIPAAALVAKKDKNFTLVLAGYDEGGYKKNIQEQISKFQLEGNVIFAGPISGREKIAALLGSDVFILPSYSEACSMALLEAMHFGLPSVITEGVGFSEEIARAGAGLRVRKEEEDIAGALLKLLSDDALRAEMGKRARLMADAEFSVESVAKKFVEAYNSIING